MEVHTMALTNEELQQILSGLSPEEQKALFEKLRQTYGDTPTPQPHPKPTSSTSKVYHSFLTTAYHFLQQGVIFSIQPVVIITEISNALGMTSMVSWQSS